MSGNFKKLLSADSNGARDDDFCFDVSFDWPREFHFDFLSLVGNFKGKAF
jgi:hypothetical protein